MRIKDVKQKGVRLKEQGSGKKEEGEGQESRDDGRGTREEGRGRETRDERRVTKEEGRDLLLTESPLCVPNYVFQLERLWYNHTQEKTDDHRQ
jgi:hypothetical protein